MTIIRAALTATLALCVFAAPLTAGAQQAGKVSRIGLLGIGAGAASPGFAALRQGLRERGYVEGQNLLIEDRSTLGHYTELRDAVAALLRFNVDVIVTQGTTTTQAAQKATNTTPIVMIAAAVEPRESGLVASFAHPGGNVTGLTSVGFELYAKRLALLKEAVPGVSRVATLLSHDSPSSVLAFNDAQPAARSLGLRLQRVDVRGPEDLEKAFARLTQERSEALAPLPNSMLRAHRARIVELAARYRLPGIYEYRGFADAGGLMSYGVDIVELFRSAATYVDKILKGAKPADLPVEQPTKFELVINMKTARVLGLTIPPSLLQRADHVIE
jgi:putative ABC transport system substrate-binding protein